MKIWGLVIAREDANKKFDIGAVLAIRDIIKGRNIDILRRICIMPDFMEGTFGLGKMTKSVLSVHNTYQSQSPPFAREPGVEHLQEG
jgi:hypothetical protein